MKIRITFPGSPEQVIEAPPTIVQHFETKGWPLPFVEVVPDNKEQVDGS